MVTEARIGQASTRRPRNSQIELPTTAQEPAAGSILDIVTRHLPSRISDAELQSYEAVRYFLRRKLRIVINSVAETTSYWVYQTTEGANNPGCLISVNKETGETRVAPIHHDDET